MLRQVIAIIVQQKVIKDRSRNAKLTTTQTEFIKDGKVDWRCEFCSISFVSKTLLNNHAKDSECSKLFYDKYRIQGLFPWNNYNKKHSNCVDCRKIIVFGGTRCKKCSTKEVANREEIRKNSSESKKGDKHWLRQPGAIHPNKDKTYIEIHGEEKSQLLKNDLSDLGKLLVGNKNPFFGKTHTEEVRKIFSENKLGKTYIEMYGEEKTKKINKKKEETWLKTIGETSPFKTTKYRENMKEFMLNGGAAHALSFVRNPSKPQIELFNLISEVCPYPIMNYPCLNKSIDIAIPKLSIAVEYDGSYFHQDKEADDIRQKLLESEGWKFLRYLDYIPSKDELLKDIIELLDK